MLVTLGLIIVGCAITLAAISALFTLGLAAWVTRTYPPRGFMVRTPSGEIHVVRQGEGAPVILIHGLAGQVGNFSHSLMEELSSSYQVIAIDRPGSGYSTRANTMPQGVRAHAAAIAEVLNALNIERPTVVGHSLGGAIALALAIDFPEQVGSLCLIAPLTVALQEPPKAFKGLRVKSDWQRILVAHTAAVPMSVLGNKATLAELFKPDVIPGDFATKGLGSLTFRPSAFIAASEDMTHAAHDMPSLIARYSEVRVPVAVLFGRSDNILDPTRQWQELSRYMPSARLELIEGGHMLPLTAPSSVASFVGRNATRGLASHR